MQRFSDVIPSAKRPVSRLGLGESLWGRFACVAVIGVLAAAWIGPAGGAEPAPADGLADQLVPGRVGKALDVRTVAGRLEGAAEFRQPPLTVECWAKLASSRSFNILVAQEPKSSATHWELFTAAGTGHLAAYLPGYTPDHARTQVNVCDNQWHHVGMTYERERVRLYLDGKVVAEERLESRGGKTVPGDLAIGALPTGELGCDGWIDELRIRRGIHSLVVEGRPESDDTTLGLWRFESAVNGYLADESPRMAAARLFTRQAAASVAPKPGGRIEGHWGEDAVGFRWTEEDSVDGRWQLTEMGPFFSGTIATPGRTTMKGLVVRLGEDGSAAICYDTEMLRPSAAWTGGFISIHPARYGLITPQRPAGKIQWTTPYLPGVGYRGKFEDTRPKKPHGPLPRTHLRYQGLHQHGKRVVLAYLVNGVQVHETPWLEPTAAQSIFSRTFQVAPSDTEVQLLICSADGRAKLAPSSPGRLITGDGGMTVLLVPPRTEVARIKVLVASADGPADTFMNVAGASPPAEDPNRWLQPGPALWTDEITTRGIVAASDAPYVVDTITLPFDNPYRALMFASGHDFFANGDAALCTAHGDVWRVSGLDGQLERIRWKRMATGLFQPLGLKIVGEKVYVLGRDQITRLHDSNGDGEVDFYENFNNEGHVTANAHEYATCLETDRAGNFYYLRGNSEGQSGHDGALLQVQPDGSSLKVFATGFRNANGMGIGPDDTITVAPQEGEWTPASAIFEVHEGGFYGFMPSHHRAERPSTYDPPLCWIPRLQDNSCGGQVWATSDRWGPLSGQLLHMSYGGCRLFVVPREKIGDVVQGGTIQLPLRFESGIMRGRFHPLDGQLYLSGLKGWVCSGARDGCFQRVRYTGKAYATTVGVRVLQNGMMLTFSEPLDRREAEDPGNYQLQRWNYLWAATYGSPEYKVSDASQEGRDDVPLRSATLLADNRTVFLEVDDLRPVMQLGVDYSLRTASGERVRQALHYTIHAIRPEAFPGDQIHRPAPAVTVDESQLRPGWLVRFHQEMSPGAVASDRRQTRMAALFVPARTAPSPRLQPGPFTAIAEGLLHVPRNQDVELFLEGRGVAKLTVNDQELLPRQELVPRAIDDSHRRLAPSGSIRLRKGWNRLAIDYSSPANGDAQLRVLWDPEDAGDEPLPPAALAFGPQDRSVKGATARNSAPAGTQGTFGAATDWHHVEFWQRGRDLLAELRCARCHPQIAGWLSGMPELAADAPRLNELRDRLEPEWLVEWLLQPAKNRDRARMPQLLDHQSQAGRQEAADLVAYLLDGKSSPLTREVPEDHSDSSKSDGTRLYESLGCMGCHRLNEAGMSDDQGRRSLAHVAVKFRPGALADYLQNPFRHSAWSEMPDFRLQRSEAVALENYLRETLARAAKEGTDRPPAESRSRGGDAERGARLFNQKGCGQCHARDGEKPSGMLAIVWEKTSADRGCLAGTPAGKGAAPQFSLTEADRAALRTFLLDPPVGATSDPVSAPAARWVTRLNCRGCHSRDAAMSVVGQVLVDESEIGLPPEHLPNLTWAGEKFQSNWVEAFVSGRSTAKPRPWLTARMPSFGPWASGLAQGLAAEHGLGADAWGPKSNPELVGVGDTLTRLEGGLDCRQCHGVGAVEPRGDKATNIALGINFAQVNRRLRYDFYRRFVLDPPRYDVNIKMPKLAADGERTNLASVYDGDARRQFEALWQFIQTVRDPTEEGREKASNAEGNLGLGDH